MRERLSSRDGHIAEMGTGSSESRLVQMGAYLAIGHLLSFSRVPKMCYLVDTYGTR